MEGSKVCTATTFNKNGEKKQENQKGKNMRETVS